MHALRRPKHTDRGAILLHTLVLVALASGLVMLVLVSARRSEDGFALLNKRLAEQLRVESAVAQVMLDLIDSGARARWLKNPGAAQFAGAGAEAIEIRVVDVRGLVDLNAAKPELIERIVPTSRRSSLRTGNAWLPGQRRRFDDYATFAAAYGLSASDLVCLHASLTLFSGLITPDPLLMPAAVARNLGQSSSHGGASTASAIEDIRPTIGRTYKLISRYLSGDSNSETLVVEFYLTGRTDRPYLMRSWVWLPTPGKDRTCIGER